MNENPGTGGRKLYRGRNLSRAVSIADLQARAHRRVPASIMEYVEGGADAECTLRRNRDAFSCHPFVQRVLRNVSTIDLTTPLLGVPAAAPVAIAPTGFNGLLWPEGDFALAQAAANAGIPFCQSTLSNTRLEDIAGIPDIRHWMQLYVFRDFAAVEGIVRRARSAGCEALVVTVDTSIFGNRTWDKRSYRKGTTLTLGRKIEALRHPFWLAGWIRNGVPTFANLAEAIPGGKTDVKSAGQWLRANLDAALDWTKLEKIRELWPGKLVLKGLMHPEDVAMAERSGMDAVVLSNHGGRQLDGTLSPLEVLESARSAAPSLDLFVDGGIRTGNDIVKARALGADGVLIGRATLYGLASGGEAGASRAIEILFEEARRCVGLLGDNALAGIGAHVLRSGFGFAPMVGPRETADGMFV